MPITGPLASKRSDPVFSIYTISALNVAPLTARATTIANAF